MSFSADVHHEAYEPRHAIDADHATYHARLTVCEACPRRWGHDCNPGQQLCSILARPAAGRCPVGLWGGSPPPIARRSSVAIPPPAGEPIIGPVYAEKSVDRYKFPPIAWDHVTRNLICHIYPRTAGQKWRRTVAHLAARPGIFNGRRIIAVATDHESDTLDEVKEAFLEESFAAEFMEFRNSNARGEVQSFPAMLADVLKAGRDDLTFYCHGKGSTWPESSAMAHEWADAMFAACLDRPEIIAKALSTAAIAGPFRRSTPLAGSSAPWHFSGTFFWVRNDAARGLAVMPGYIDPIWSGVEAWPGVQFGRQNSACLFLDKAGDLYHADYWDKTVRPALRLWKESNL